MCLRQLPCVSFHAFKVASEVTECERPLLLGLACAPSTAHVWKEPAAHWLSPELNLCTRAHVCKEMHVFNLENKWSNRFSFILFYSRSGISYLTKE